MAFQLDQVVPWGRNLEEYRRMFLLENGDLAKKIAGFGDGPASFNGEATRLGCSVVSFDPVYRFSKEALAQRIEEVRGTVMQQMKENQAHYVWDQIPSLEALEALRMSAMSLFLADYEQGKQEGRYVPHALPQRLPVAENTFDLGLSSHFLLLYPMLGYAFHIRAISEMLRVCKEVRIFPIVDLDANSTQLTQQVLDYFQKDYTVTLADTRYRFQKGDNRLLILTKT